MLRARDYNPAVKHGARWLPSDLAGIIGQPHVGEIYYLDANSGSDSSGGKSWEDAFKTLAAAEDVCTTNNYDVIIVAPAGTGGTAETATITWDKNHITVIGGAAPTGISQRARVGWGTDAVDPCINITGHGNRFINLQLNTYQASNDVLVAMTGNRNYFENVHFAGIGHATAGDDATARCLALTGAEENRFVGCNFGLDTVARSTTNSTIEFLSASSRNVFEGCRFIMHADNVGPNHILFTGSSAIDRWVQFDNCVFYSFWTNDADKITHVIDMAAQTTTGHCLMTGHNTMIGADDWEAADSGNVYFQGYTNTSNVVGIGINPAVS